MSFCGLLDISTKCVAFMLTLFRIYCRFSRDESCLCAMLEEHLFRSLGYVHASADDAHHGYNPVEDRGQPLGLVNEILVQMMMILKRREIERGGMHHIKKGIVLLYPKDG